MRATDRPGSRFPAAASRPPGGIAAASGLGAGVRLMSAQTEVAADAADRPAPAPSTEQLQARIRELEQRVEDLQAERDDGTLDLADVLATIEAKEADEETARHWQAFVTALGDHLGGLGRLPFGLRAAIEELNIMIGR